MWIRIRIWAIVYPNRKALLIDYLRGCRILASLPQIIILNQFINHTILGLTMKKITFLFCIVFFGLFSCKTSSPPSLHELFEEPIPLKASIIDIPSLRLGNPFSLDLLDTLLIINDWHPDKNLQMEYFTLLDVKNKAVIRRFGKEGKGPNEILQPLSAQLNKNTGLFTTFLAGNQSIVSVSMDSLMLAGNFIGDKINMLNHGLFTRGIRVDGKDVVYVGIGLFDNAKYRILDASGKNIVADLGKIYNQSNQDYNNAILGMVFQGRLKPHPHEEKFVYCSTANDLIEIVDLKKGIIAARFESYYPKFRVENGQAAFEKDNDNGYCDVAATKKYIYCLFSGRSVDEYGGQALKANNIFVFDWELNPVTSYLLDCDVQAIAVSEDDSYLYSSSIIDDEFELIKFEMIKRL